MYLLFPQKHQQLSSGVKAGFIAKKDHVTSLISFSVEKSPSKCQAGRGQKCRTPHTNSSSVLQKYQEIHSTFSPPEKSRASHRFIECSDEKGLIWPLLHHLSELKLVESSADTLCHCRMSLRFCGLIQLTVQRPATHLM